MNTGFQSYLALLMIWFCCVLAPQPVHAQQDSVQEDSSALTVRDADFSRIEGLTRSGDFDYAIPREPESFWERIQRWLIQQISRAAENKWVELFFKVSFFAIFTAILIGLINQLMGGQIKNTFSGNKSSDSLNISSARENISDIDLDAEINKALEQSRYSDALRLLYLKTLQDLNRQGLIAQKADKTNHEYLNELKTHDSYSAFNRFTNIYEFVEYGGFSIGEKGYEKAVHLYETIGRSAGEQK